MSHFSVLVIGDNVEAQLQPYHEFECTGTNDAFVQTLDETLEKTEEFKAATRSMVKLADGTLFPRYDDQFWVPAPEDILSHPDVAKHSWSSGGSINGTRWGRKQVNGEDVVVVWQLPEGAEAVEVPFDSLSVYLADYCEIKPVAFGAEPDLEGDHKYNYFTFDSEGNVDKVFRRTNPNAKWDWWVMGGRWSGFFTPRNDLMAGNALMQKGEPGLMGSQRDPHGIDSLLKSQIDFEKMRGSAGDAAAEKWDKVARAKEARGLAAGALWVSWDKMREEIYPGDIDAARDAYNAQEAVKAVKAVFDHPFHKPDELLMSRDAYIERARNRATVPYAVVRAGEWLAKGDMGWWGMSFGEGDPDEWNKKVNELIDSLDPLERLTIVDCHI